MYYEIHIYRGKKHLTTPGMKTKKETMELAHKFLNEYADPESGVWKLEIYKTKQRALASVMVKTWVRNESGVFVEDREAIMPSENQRFKTFEEWAVWMVTLWIESEEGAYGAWQERVAVLQAEAPESENVLSGIWTEEEAVRFTLAEELKEWVEEMVEQLDLEVGILSEFLEYGVTETPWQVVAGNLIGE